ncbi:MAG: sugar phosphate nucleotidyltransferase [Patescibacteria group bacterium]
MENNNFAAIILAGGVGRRMKSARSKVLHPIGDKPMIQKTVEVVKKANPAQIIVVANKHNYKELKAILKGVSIVVQEKPQGTADAALIGLGSLNVKTHSTAILYGDDTAFYKPQTILAVFKAHRESASSITFVTVKKTTPYGLGRIVRKNGALVAIVEEKDASESQKKITEVNDGLYFFNTRFLEKNIRLLAPSSATGELYITDLIELGLNKKEKVETFLLQDEDQWHGINTQTELIRANLRLNKHIHFMGISGAGAAACAGIASQLGNEVTGCDVEPNSPYINRKKIKVLKNHDQSHDKGISCLILSPAVEKLDFANPEIIAAKKAGIPVISWQQFMGEILQENKFVVAVAGGYGKSTTTAMISKILIDAKLDPTCQLGAKVLDWNSNFIVGKSKYFICEADEYNDNFLNYHPYIAIVLNLAWDHPDYFKTKNALYNSYANFVNNTRENGLLIINPKSYQKLKDKIRKDIKIRFIEEFNIRNLKIIGNFRKENANAALSVAKALNLGLKGAIKSVQTFNGLGRRLEFKGKIANTTFYDDYAVQPYTILKTANAIKEKFSKNRTLLVLEPHTYSRVNKYLKEFIRALRNTKVDRVLITNTFAAREKGDSIKTSKNLVKLVGNKATYTGTIQNTAAIIGRQLKDYDLVCSMGAGDIYKIYDLVKNG